jgi:hypothetical protein
MPAIPMRGRLGILAGGWRYAWSQPTALAISPEDARVFSLVGSLVHPWLGAAVLNEDGTTSPLTQVQLTGELREYIVNPWLPNHVLAMRFAGGLTIGANNYLGNYQLGGNFGDQSFAATPDTFRMLRGYPLGTEYGDMYWLTGFEYRLPLWRIDRGVGTIPVFLRALSAVAFLDAGHAFTEATSVRDVLADPLVGAGAELRLSTALGWAVGLTGRLGYGFALTPGGFSPLDPRSLYFQLGGSF